MKKIFLFFFCILLMTLNCYSQNSRDYVKKSISSWGVCRNVAITDTGGDIALNYSNQYSYSGIPRGLANAIKELHDDGEFIDDIQLTENGHWLILYGNNGFRWSNVPSDLEDALRDFNYKREVVTSVTFNDYGNWIIISTEHIRASSTDVYGWIEDGINSFGQLWAAHITNDGLVLCFEDGYKFMGNVSERLRNALKSAKFDVFRIKFTSRGSYFFADKDGRFSYWM